MRSVLFVCSANICRSPMAMALLQAMTSSESQDWRIESAGVNGLVGYPAANYSRLVMAKRGLSLSDHRAQQITRDMVARFNLVLTMERGQKEALRAAYPEYASRVRLLSEMIGEIQDVVDPIGCPLQDFEDTAQEIDQILRRGYDKIRRLAEDTPNRSAS